MALQKHIPQLRKDKRVLILGGGRTGLACKNWLEARGYATFLWDDKQSPVLENLPWVDISAVIQSPGIPFLGERAHLVTQQARKLNISIMSDINLFKMFYTNSCVGITGTNGKSTVTALLGHMYAQFGFDTFVAGNIGRAVMDIPINFSDDTHCFFELSSYQLEISLPLDLDVAIFLNLSPDHLTRHGTMEDYFSAKMNVFNGARFAIVGVDDAWGQKAMQQLIEKFEKDHLFTFSAYHTAASLFVDERGQVFLFGKKQAQLPPCYMTFGIHNRQNVASVLAVCRALKIDLEKAIQAITSFNGLDHRQKCVRTLREIGFINDSKATNVMATKQALTAYYNENVYWIAGGQAKEGDDLNELTPYLKSIKEAFLIGEAQEDFATFLAQQGVKYHLCNDLATAVQTAHKIAEEKGRGVVLLSPACASFDQFKDFEDRGRSFTSIVERLV